MATKTQKKYKLLKNDTKTSWNGKTLFRIEALIDFSIFHEGEKGGYIENEANLSQDDESWVFGNAQVSGDARVFGNARVFGIAWVSGNARVFGNAWVSLRADVTTNIDFEIPRIALDSKEKLDKLMKTLTELKLEEQES